MVLLRSQLACPECEEALDLVDVEYGTVDGEVEFESAWVPVVDRETIRCGNGHRFVAVYEQREPWRRCLVGFGDRLDG